MEFYLFYFHKCKKNIIIFFKFLYFQSDSGAPTSPLPSPRKHSADDAASSDTPKIGFPRNLRLLHRTMSEEMKHRRRDSMPTTPVQQAEQRQTASEYSSSSLLLLLLPSFPPPLRLSSLHFFLSSCRSSSLLSPLSSPSPLHPPIE